jgi:GAF domain-containing protein
VIGILEILNKKEGAFNAADEKLLQSIAVTISIALRNVQLDREKLAQPEQQPLQEGIQ